MNYEFNKKLVRRQPQWIVSFADLMALLLALFVMLLSFAEIDSDSFRRNAGPISQVFDRDHVIIEEPKSKQIVPLEDVTTESQTFTPEQTKLRLRVLLIDEINRDDIEILEVDERIIIRFNDRAGFEAGTRRLQPGALLALDKIVEVLAQTTGKIYVEGHTDNVPIRTEMFRSNWDLSTARASTVVHYLLRKNQIEATRILAVGLADSQPLVPNTTPENRARNRRVEIALDTKGSHEDEMQINIMRYR